MSMTQLRILLEILINDDSILDCGTTLGSNIDHQSMRFPYSFPIMRGLADGPSSSERVSESNFIN